MNIQRIKRLLPTTILLLVSASGAWAGDIKWHGFASQAYLYSTGGNNIYGESTEGSSEYFEVGLGAQYHINNSLHVAGQLLSRDAGATDNGSIRTDYLYADLRIAQLNDSALGLRAGRVRNPLGFYNATRDVLFTRPSILLPQMYYDASGVRELFFSADGVQLYGYWDHGGSTTSFTSTFGRNNTLSSKTFDNIVSGNGSAVGEASLKNPIFAQLMHSSLGQQWKAGLSLMNATLDYRATGGLLPSGSLEANLVAVSAQRNFEKLSITAEYALLSSTLNFGALNGAMKSESLYLQGEFRATPHWTGLIRIDNQLGDRERPNETDTLILTLGARWMPTKNWQIAAELHGMRGTAGIPRPDNALNLLYARTELFVIMAGFRF